MNMFPPPSINTDLQAGQIVLRRHGRFILDHIDLHAGAGRVLALLGPNGTGKSSLLGVLAGQTAPSEGWVRLHGLDLQRWPAQELARRRAKLSQHVQLDFAFRVAEVVRLGRSARAQRCPHALEQRIIDAVLEMVSARHLRARNYLTLSGGEQRRVQLARVLAQLWEPGAESGWLLLDEPEAGLDIAHQHALLQLTRRLAHRGFGIVVVLHDLNLAARYADDIALLSAGRLLAHGRPTDVLQAARLSQLYGLPLRRIELPEGGFMITAEATSPNARHATRQPRAASTA